MSDTSQIKEINHLALKIIVLSFESDGGEAEEYI